MNSSVLKALSIIFVLGLNFTTANAQQKKTTLINPEMLFSYLSTINPQYRISDATGNVIADATNDGLEKRSDFYYTSHNVNKPY